MAHMNKDHRADMRAILAYFPAVPPVPSPFPYDNQTKPGDEASDTDTDPLMTDISLTSFTLTMPPRAGGTSHVVAFDPPLASWAERRARLVEMTRVARAAAGGGSPSSASSSSPHGLVVGGGDSAAGTTADGGGVAGEQRGTAVRVTSYVPPRVPYDVAVFGGVVFYFACFALVQAGYFADGGVLAREVVRFFPGGAAGFRWLVRAIFVPVLGIHLTETWWLERSRLRAHGVRRGSGVWWLWVGSVFFEGVMAFKRFDLLVARLRREQTRKGQ
ncbi:uncharacterized protein THITE_2123316 [Thermothielavioides terrestris NRRL 8126]|uniref:DUF2470 domain-containing protein n=1 Tax=Thermothielavioides terrestris (strain ATCC 38088 / NRRL 8126) TaxID=578455 RepID=G2RH67_THETT|nr:uncharacterized protein THITE_2123316 [Thermothielavioides terrestris NRRL 8126]AEO71179.1 hypothetical protein THITE_2123316 [Thermothielavioides terrestris NRRL 8126]